MVVEWPLVHWSHAGCYGQQHGWFYVNDDDTCLKMYMLGIWVQLSVDKAVEGSTLSICVCLDASLPIRVTLPYMGCACVWIVLFHVGVGIPL